ncbi:MAG: hypothetical protein JWM34_3686 [Ilumatobacteraceae bacterium]|nr:hypothetical protein [Ilumatobacteraceae bacterium]
MRLPRYRSPLARAVMPVLAGIGFFGVLGLLLWGAAAYIAHHSDQRSKDFAPSTFEVGRTTSIAATVTDDGPLIFPDLLRSSGQKTIVLDHVGDDPQQGWRIYLAYPADRTVDCKVTQIRHTRNYTDCNGRTIAVEALAAPPDGVLPIVSADGTLTLDLLPNAAPSTTIAGTGTVATTS